MNLSDLGQVSTVPPEDSEPGRAPASTGDLNLNQLGQVQTEEDYKQQKYGTLGQQALAGVEGLASGLVSAPIATAVEKYTGLATPEDIAGRAETMAHDIGQGIGLLAPALGTFGASTAVRAGLEVPGAVQAGAMALAKYSQAGLLSKVGEAGAALTGLGAEGASALSRIGSSAVAGAIENSLFSAGDIGSKIVLGQDPSEAVQTAVPYLGLSAVLGGTIGAGLGSVPELWKAFHGSNTGGILRAVTDKLGGNEKVLSDPVSKAMETLGVEATPGVTGALAEDPALREVAKALEQSTSNSGLAHQEDLQKNFFEQSEKAVAGSFGKTPEELQNLERISERETGQEIGKTFSSEVKEHIDPLSDAYDAHSKKYDKAPLLPSLEDRLPVDTKSIADAQKDLAKQTRALEKAQKLNSPEASIEAAAKVEEAQAELLKAQKDSTLPGTTDVLSDKLSDLAIREGWNKNPDGPGMQAVNKVLKQLPLQKTLGDLSQFIKNVGDEMQAGKPFGDPSFRIGGQIKSILRKEEGNILGHFVGSEEGVEALTKYRELQAAYAGKAELKDAIQSRLGIKGASSVRGYGRAVSEFSDEFGEKFLSKIAKTNDAGFLELLQTSFPRTADQVRQYHLNDLLETAVKKAKKGEGINVTALKSSIEKMSPELREFVVPKGVTDKLDALQLLQDQYAKTVHNSSNTGRASGVMNKYGMGTAMGMVSMLTGHGVIGGLAAGQLAHTLSKTAPDAARLSLLKFLASDQPINGTAFKAMADFIHASIKGENLLSQATKSLFKAGSKVLPDSQIPNQESRDKLEKSLKHNSSLDGAMGASSNLNHYLPGHQAASSALTATATNYLNSLKPVRPQASPLDKPLPVDKGKQAAYNRALDIAEQPLLVLEYVKRGTLQAGDVKTLQTLYPALHAQIVAKIYNEMTQALADGQAIPYHQRLSLSLLMGKGLDSSMTSEAMQSVIMANAPKQTPPQGGSKVTKATPTSMSKVDALYATPSQARAAHRSQ